MIKKIMTLIFVLFIIIISSFILADDTSPYPGQLDDWDNYWTEYNTMFDWTIPVFSFNEPGQTNWYPVADWELKVCSNDFSSDFTLDDTLGSMSMSVDGRIYDLTIALNPELMQTSFTDEEGNSQQLFTIGWYIQGLPSGGSSDNNVKYGIKFGNTDLDLGSGETEKEFSIMTGTSGFYTNYTKDCPEEVVLTIKSESNTKTYRQLISFLDENFRDSTNKICNWADVQ